MVYANTEFTCLESLAKIFFGRGIVESNLVEGPYKFRLSKFVPSVNVDFLCTKKAVFLVRTRLVSLVGCSYAFRVFFIIRAIATLFDNLFKKFFHFLLQTYLKNRPNYVIIRSQYNSRMKTNNKPDNNAHVR